MKSGIEPFFHAPSHTWAYVAWDPESRRSAMVDPVLDYDPAGGHTGTAFARQMLEFVRSRDLAVDWILETHAHADHLTAADFLKRELGARVGIGAGIRQVQETFADIFNLPGFAADGRPFDRLFEDGERFAIGAMEVEVLHTPGHTSDSVSYRIDDAVFIGDTLFAPDYGSARVDFPGGDARDLYRSVQRLFDLPGETRLFLCHDYPPGTREPQAAFTIAEQRATNVHLHDGVTEDTYVALREARDRDLPLPDLILPAVQVNMRAGCLPPPEDNGVSYLKIPLDTDWIRS